MSQAQSEVYYLRVPKAIADKIREKADHDVRTFDQTCRVIFEEYFEIRP
jgi:hypothetical protein